MTTPPAGFNADAPGNSAYPPLLNEDDFADFSSLDQDWFLAAAGETVRNYLHWHVAPSITETRYCDMTGDGTILLPTRYLTGVTSVTPSWNNAQPIDTGAYHFDQGGWIRLKQYQYGFAPTPASTDLWPIDTVRLFDAYPKHNKRMIVEFTHGYPNLPYPVAEVAYELAMRVMEKPAGIATDIQAGPYKYTFMELGMLLTADQKNRLAYYKLPGIA